MLGIIIAFILTALGSYTDLKTREVPDWLNYAGIITGIALHLFISLAQQQFWPLAESLAGLSFGASIGLIMYYTGQWGGGDSKMLMALGALLGFWPHLDHFFVGFLINFIIAGGIYGILWCLALTARNWKKVSTTWLAIRKDYWTLRLLALLTQAALFLLLLLTPDTVFRILLAGGILITALLTFLYTLIKAVEHCCLLKRVPPTILTEGDWIAEEIIIGKKRICGPQDLGLTKKQLQQLQELYKKKTIKTILMKQGIPFIPSFFGGLLITQLFGNPLLWIL